MTDSLQGAQPIGDRFRLNGKVALVTGAGQGIGRAFAHALGEAGAAVAVADVAEERARAVADELTSKGIDALALGVDVTRTEGIAAMVEAVLGRWGHLTIAFNNAGIGQWAAAESMTEADWDRMLDLNLKAVFRCCQAVGRVMLAAGYGKIINTASMSGSVVNRPQNQVAYNTSKAAVIHLTRSLAAEWAGRGVRVNCISPGYTRTPLVDALLDSPEGRTMAPQWVAMTPLGRIGEVTDLQGAALFLAAPASDFMTGQDVIVDGGYCLW